MCGVDLARAVLDQPNHGPGHHRYRGYTIDISSLDSIELISMHLHLTP
jgi:hypothetical protein